MPWGTVLLTLAVMALAAALRLPGLGEVGYQPDELWSTELATGRGSAHLRLPLDQLIRPPIDLLTLTGAPPWWHVWPSVSECTHPPLFFVALRLWMMAFGQGDGTERMLSVIASVVAAGFLFDAVRVLNGRTAALWAAVLFALAEPQVDYARLTRNYAVMVMFATAAADAVVRIERLGLTRRRWAGLTLAVLGTLLSHYFCLGAMAALGVYAVVCMRGRIRLATLASMATAGLAFVIVWGPFMWRQRSLFATTDESTSFLVESGPGHVGLTLGRFAKLPVQMLLGPRTALVPWAGWIGAAFLLATVVAAWRRPALRLWALWLVLTPGVVMSLDLARQTCHLAFVRYTLLAGPAVFAVLPSLIVTSTRGLRWARHLPPALATVACLLAVPAAFEPTAFVDPNAIAREFAPKVRPDDLFLFIATGHGAFAIGTNEMMVTRYFHPLTCATGMLDAPATGDLRARAAASRVFAFTLAEDVRRFVPNRRVLGQQPCLLRGTLWTLGPVVGN